MGGVHFSVSEVSWTPQNHGSRFRGVQFSCLGGVLVLYWSLRGALGRAWTLFSEEEAKARESLQLSHSGTLCQHPPSERLYRQERQF